MCRGGGGQGTKRKVAPGVLRGFSHGLLACLAEKFVCVGIGGWLGLFQVHVRAISTEMAGLGWTGAVGGLMVSEEGVDGLGGDCQGCAGKWCQPPSRTVLSP